MARIARSGGTVKLTVYVAPATAARLHRDAEAAGFVHGSYVSVGEYLDSLDRQPQHGPASNTATEIVVQLHTMESHPTLGRRCRDCGMLAAACKKHPNCTKEPPK